MIDSAVGAAASIGCVDAAASVGYSAAQSSIGSARVLVPVPVSALFACFPPLRSDAALSSILSSDPPLRVPLVAAGLVLASCVGFCAGPPIL